MKFKVNEVCEARSRIGRFEGWRDAEIIGNEGPYISTLGIACQYLIQVQGIPKTTKATEDQLRKKFNPPADQWQVADEDFLDDMKGLLPIRDDEKVARRTGGLFKALMEKRDED